jgi:GNAT superfamily N-acetyltransferase
VVHGPFTIRSWRPGDDVAGHIARIYAEFGLCFDPAFEDDLLDVGASYARACFLVAEDSAGLAGTAAACAEGGVRLVRRMYVAPRARRTGLARALLARCLAWGNFRRTELWSDVRFRGAHALYRGEGFVPGPCRVLDDPDRSVERFFAREGTPGTG